MEEFEEIRELNPEVEDETSVSIPNITAVGIVMAAFMPFNLATKKQRVRCYKMLYEHTGDERYKIKYLQLTKSNNWMRMHGYPMRRKIHH